MNNKDKKDEQNIVVELPAVLEKAIVVLNMDHLAFTGDVPVGISYIHLMTNHFRELNIKGQIIAVFHDDAGYMRLNDEAYDAYGKVTTGNLYEGLLVELLKQGGQIEECVVSMKNHAW